MNLHLNASYTGPQVVETGGSWWVPRHASALRTPVSPALH